MSLPTATLHDAPAGGRARRGALAIATLAAALQIACWNGALAREGAEGPPENGNTVQVTKDQMHQLNIVKVKPHKFNLQKPAIGQIAFNEDASTVVVTPFSGRVTRLLAKIGDEVKRGDPLFEIDSPEVL
jgi:cobalt-zinc-cadmium efflux system membrane fusion protein